MKISPTAIRQKAFETSFRGYEKKQVSDFLEEMSVVMEQINQENLELRSRLQQVEGEAKRLKDVEDSLFRTLKTAEDTGAAIITEATEAADQIIGEANQIAEQTTREAQRYAEQLGTYSQEQARVITQAAEENAKETTRVLAENIKGLIKSYEGLVEQREALVSQLRGMVSERVRSPRRLCVRHESLLPGLVVTNWQRSRPRASAVRRLSANTSRGSPRSMMQAQG